MQRSDFYKANEAMPISVAAKVDIGIALVEAGVFTDKQMIDWLNYKGGIDGYLALINSSLGKELF